MSFASHIDDQDPKSPTEGQLTGNTQGSPRGPARGPWKGHQSLQSELASSPAWGSGVGKPLPPWVATLAHGEFLSQRYLSSPCEGQGGSKNEGTCTSTRFSCQSSSWPYLLEGMLTSRGCQAHQGLKKDPTPEVLSTSLGVF